MTERLNDDPKEVLWTKCIIYSVIILFLIIFMIIIPKKVFDENAPFILAISIAITDDDNLMLYDYDVYGTEERFNEGLDSDVSAVKADFKERNEILVVKIYDEDITTEVRNDYIFMTHPDIPELNIEYHLVKNVSINNIYIQSRAFIMLFQDISKIINFVYFALVFVFFVSTFTPFSIKLSRSIIFLIREQKKTS